MKIRTSELIGPGLDWAVEKALPWRYYGRPTPAYSTNWAHGGPIIACAGIGVWPSESGDHDGEWCARMIDTYITYSPTPLIAAMRCYVASKLGVEIEVPDELIGV